LTIGENMIYVIAETNLQNTRRPLAAGVLINPVYHHPLILSKYFKKDISSYKSEKPQNGVFNFIRNDCSRFLFFCFTHKTKGRPDSGSPLFLQCFKGIIVLFLFAGFWISL
jgi:hypothetical protein